MKYTFEMALAYLKQGKKVRRAAWRHAHKRVEILAGKLYEVFDLCLLTSDDVLAEDWEVVDENGSEMEINGKEME